MHEAALSWAAAELGHAAIDVEPLLGGWTSTVLALTDASGGRSVLQLVTEEPWRAHGAGLAARESQVRRQLVGMPVPAPHSIALDEHGMHCGVAAHLMGLVPGAVDSARVSDDDLDRLADLLARLDDHLAALVADSHDG